MEHEGGVVYQKVGSEYFAKRGLRRHAGVFSLWALGVAAVISGVRAHRVRAMGRLHHRSGGEH
jgi:hypothetical protein